MVDASEKHSNKINKCFNTIVMRERLKFVREIVTIEPMMCCTAVALTLCEPAVRSLQFEKACRVNAGFNETVCEAILNGTYVENNFLQQNNVVQHHMTNLRSWEIPITSVVPVILVLFLGSFSDNHKLRKPFLLMPCFGALVGALGNILNVIYMHEWSLEVQVIFYKVIPSFSGAQKLSVMITSAYIADISTPEMRTLRLAMIPILNSVFLPIAQPVSGILFRSVGYIPVFLITFILLSASTLYGITMVKEPKKIKPDTRKTKTEVVFDVFNVKHVTSTLMFFKKLKGRNRLNLSLVLLLSFIYTFINNGEGSAFYLFTQTAYQWTVVDYSYFSTIKSIVNLVGLVVFVPLFLRVFGLHDLIIILMSYLGGMSSNAIYVTVQSSIGVYLGCIFTVFRYPGYQAMRAQISKCVTADDTAKAMCLSTIVSAVSSSIAAQAYHKGIYEYTRTSFPQAFFLLGIAIYGAEIILVMWMYFKNRVSDDKSSKEHIPDQEIATHNDTLI